MHDYAVSTSLDAVGVIQGGDIKGLSSVAKVQLSASEVLHSTDEVWLGFAAVTADGHARLALESS